METNEQTKIVQKYKGTVIGGENTSGGSVKGNSKIYPNAYLSTAP
jgi:hypothetical protein